VISCSNMSLARAVDAVGDVEVAEGPVLEHDALAI
jgi:hypothetical protein